MFECKTSSDWQRMNKGPRVSFYARVPASALACSRASVCARVPASALACQRLRSRASFCACVPASVCMYGVYARVRVFAQGYALMHTVCCRMWVTKPPPAISSTSNTAMAVHATGPLRCVGQHRQHANGPAQQHPFMCARACVRACGWVRAGIGRRWYAHTARI